MSWYQPGFTSNERRSSRLLANCKRFSRRLSTGIFRAVSRIQTNDQQSNNQSNSLQQSRSLDEILKSTRFTKAEIRLLYRSFKQECPDGIVSEERLRSIYLQFFPQGNANRYIHYLFSTIDRNRKGTFRFDDYVFTLSIVCRGTIDEKLRWIFRLYDVNNNGKLTRQDVHQMILSLHELLGPFPCEESGIDAHVEQIFQKIEPESEDFITPEDFISFCKKRNSLIESVESFSHFF